MKIKPQWTTADKLILWCCILVFTVWPGFNALNEGCIPGALYFTEGFKPGRYAYKILRAIFHPLYDEVDLFFVNIIDLIWKIVHWSFPECYLVNGSFKMVREIYPLLKGCQGIYYMVIAISNYPLHYQHNRSIIVTLNNPGGSTPWIQMIYEN